MGSDQYRTPRKIICVLCHNSDETETTGALSSKDDISAHQNCLLYASGIYCKNSPTYDDLFGFTVTDVRQEVRRGRKLTCHHCKKSGATAGCEVRRCKHSFHYPCAQKANARVVEDLAEGRYILYCVKHDPQGASSVTSDVPSTSSLNSSKKRGSSDCRGRITHRRESNSSTGSSEQGNAYKPKNTTTSDIIPDDEIQTCPDSTFGPLESDLDDCTPPLVSSTPLPQCSRTCEKSSSSSTARTFMNTHLNDFNGDNPGQLNKRVVLDSPSSSPDTPRRKKKRTTVLQSDDDSQTSIDSPLAKACTPPRPHNHSTPVDENKRPNEGLNALPTEDDDDTDIDTESSQSLLPSEPYNVTVQCTVFIDSGPSIESENSLESSSPSKSVAPEPVETASTNTASEPKAPNTDLVIPGSPDRAPQQECSENCPSDQPMSPDHSNPTSDPPAGSQSVIQPLPESHITTDHPAARSPPEATHTSPHHPGVADASDADATASLESSVATFWARCNEAGCTEEIFSELVSQLSSLGERVQSQEATEQDFDVALNVLEASGRLPTILTRLEQDLEKQEQELLKKKAALRDARAALRF